MEADIQDPKTAEIFEKADMNRKARKLNLDDVVGVTVEKQAEAAFKRRPDPPMHDSGQRQEFATGAVRDTAEDKPSVELISPFAVRRLGDWLSLGAGKYSPRNWEQGIPLSRCTASMYRHLLAWMAGETNEDHLAAVMCNAMFMMHYQDQIDKGNLPDTLNDMPNYNA